MAWNNNYNNNNNNWNNNRNNNGYNNNNNWNNNRNNNNNYNNNNNNNKPNSGATFKKYTPNEGPNAGKQQYFVSAWKKTRYGLIVYTCVSTKHSQQSEKHEDYISGIMCTVLNKSTGQKSQYWGAMNVKKGVVIIPELGVQIVTYYKNGFVGKMKKRR